MRNYFFSVFFLLSSPIFAFQACILVFGPPGCGKGTFSQFLKTNHHYNHISAGDLVRNEIVQKTSIGLQIEEIVKQGKFIDSEIMHSLIRSKVHELCRYNKSFIIDGFGHTQEDLQFLHELLDSLNLINKTFILFLDSPNEVCEQRILSRQVCPQCGHVYNIQSVRPQINKQCDLCSAPLKQRLNDTKQVIKKRIKDYRSKTEATYKKACDFFPVLFYQTNKNIQENTQWYSFLAENIDSFEGDSTQFCTLVREKPNLKEKNI